MKRDFIARDRERNHQPQVALVGEPRNNTKAPHCSDLKSASATKVASLIVATISSLIPWRYERRSIFSFRHAQLTMKPMGSGFRFFQESVISIIWGSS